MGKLTVTLEGDVGICAPIDVIESLKPLGLTLESRVNNYGLEATDSSKVELVFKDKEQGWSES